MVGTVDEDFAVESLAGDIMLLGNTSWRIRAIESKTGTHAGGRCARAASEHSVLARRSTGAHVGTFVAVGGSASARQRHAAERIAGSAYRRQSG